MKNLRIVFMGTPDFAVATLGSLLMNGFNVVGVVTTPDKPAGRGRKINKSPVKEFAESSHLPILQPENLKDPEFIENLKNLKADFNVVVAFRMLPEVVWKMPEMGTFNLHASLLPQYRGAAPINHAIINGETITGITTFLIDEKIDTGNILLREEVHIFPLENAGDIHDRLMKQGARLVIRTLEGLSEGKLKPLSQSQFIKTGEVLKAAPKIFPKDCLINRNNDPVTIHNLVRGLSPAPSARTVIRNGTSDFSFKIFESQPEVIKHDLNPGDIISDGKHFMKIACRDGFLSVVNLQLEGKRRMNTVEFLRGFKIKDYKIRVS
ncbi:MAG: methionyl-tRNA formyltransferase [Bacteroidales bacterium]|nr:methionyl-tRNA formyltransferase [Bacteroidales bacterium]